MATDHHGMFEKLFQETPYSDSARKMADELGVDPLTASALAQWVWLFNRIHNNARRLTLSPGRRKTLDIHLSSVTDGRFTDSLEILDAMYAADWVDMNFDQRRVTVDFLTWERINKAAGHPGNVRPIAGGGR